MTDQLTPPTLSSRVLIELYHLKNEGKPLTLDAIYPSVLDTERVPIGLSGESSYEIDTDKRDWASNPHLQTEKREERRIMMIESVIGYEQMGKMFPTAFVGTPLQGTEPVLETIAGRGQDGGYIWQVSMADPVKKGEVVQLMNMIDNGFLAHAPPGTTLIDFLTGEEAPERYQQVQQRSNPVSPMNHSL